MIYTPLEAMVSKKNIVRKECVPIKNLPACGEIFIDSVFMFMDFLRHDIIETGCGAVKRAPAGPNATPAAHTGLLASEAITMDTRIPMIAMTIKSSINVNPRYCVFRR